MEINPEIINVLKECKIDKSQGLLALLAIYFRLDAETTCSEETIKAINLTKIVEKDYSSSSNTIRWNLPLFMGEENDFTWVKDWVEGFGLVNPDRKGSWKDAITRMKDFFRKNPEFNREDVYAARNLYFKTLNKPLYCMHSHKFIYDGVGAMKKSTLLQYCEKVKENQHTNDQKGKIIT